jgi:hypothetical protein
MTVKNVDLTAALGFSGVLGPARRRRLRVFSGVVNPRSRAGLVNPVAFMPGLMPSPGLFPREELYPDAGRKLR